MKLMKLQYNHKIYIIACLIVVFTLIILYYYFNYSTISTTTKPETTNAITTKAITKPETTKATTTNATIKPETTITKPNTATCMLIVPENPEGIYNTYKQFRELIKDDWNILSIYSGYDGNHYYENITEWNRHTTPWTIKQSTKYYKNSERDLDSIIDTFNKCIKIFAVAIDIHSYARSPFGTSGYRIYYELNLLDYTSKKIDVVVINADTTKMAQYLDSLQYNYTNTRTPENRKLIFNIFMDHKLGYLGDSFVRHDITE